jgi:hypothetical protein
MSTSYRPGVSRSSWGADRPLASTRATDPCRRSPPPHPGGVVTLCSGWMAPNHRARRKHPTRCSRGPGVAAGAAAYARGPTQRIDESGARPACICWTARSCSEVQRGRSGAYQPASEGGPFPAVRGDRSEISVPRVLGAMEPRGHRVPLPDQNGGCLRQPRDRSQAPGHPGGTGTLHSPRDRPNSFGDSALSGAVYGGIPYPDRTGSGPGCEAGSQRAAPGLPLAPGLLAGQPG